MTTTGHSAHPRSATRRLALACAGLILAIAPAPVFGQLAYNGTVFVHGFGSDSRIWTNNFQSLGGASGQAYLGRNIALKAVNAPSLPANQNYDGQLTALEGVLAGTTGGNVLVGHSLGVNEARGAYVFRGDATHVAAIIALTPPHQGTRLADNAQQAARFFADVQYRVDDGARAAKIVATLAANIIATFVFGGVFHVGPYVMGAIWASISYYIMHYNVDTDLSLDQLYNYLTLPAVADLKTNSWTIQQLNANMQDAAIPRANIVATLPSFRNAAIYVKASLTGTDPQATISQRDDAVGKFRTCKVVGYIMIVTASAARRCSFAAKVLGRVDDEWMGFVNGYDAYGHPRAVPFDGVVSNELSHYPSPNLLPFDTKVVGPNHQSIYSTTDGLDATTQAMLRLSMDRAPLNTSGIVGPGSMPADYTRSWSITVYGATPPYRYQWSGILSGTQRFISGTPATSGNLYVDVWDITGQHVRKSIYVTLIAGCGGRIAC